MTPAVVCSKRGKRHGTFRLGPMFALSGRVRVGTVPSRTIVGAGFHAVYKLQCGQPAAVRTPGEHRKVPHGPAQLTRGLRPQPAIDSSPASSVSTSSFCEGEARTI